MAAPYRADQVGSLLRPPELLQARTDYGENRITAEQLHETEDAAVLKALEMQRAAGIDVFSGGEYRRAGWSTVIRESVEGLVPDPDRGTRRITWEGPHADVANASADLGGLVAGAKLRQVRRLTGDDAAFLKQHAPGPWKMTLPGPMSAAGQLWKAGITDQFYPSRQEFVNEIVDILRREIDALIDEGVSYIQLDSLRYVDWVANMTIRARRIEDGEDPEAYLDEVIAADNAVLEGVRREGLTVGLHMCRGNHRSAWYAAGSYEPVAEKAFNLLNVHRFLLEYDTERAGSFEPLRFMPTNKLVALGLVSSKEPALESGDLLLRRIDEATKYVPLENLALCPQCGFASTALGNLLSWDEQRRKLELVAETARKVWG